VKPQLPFGMDTTKWYIHKPPQHGIWIVHPPSGRSGVERPSTSQGRRH